MITLGRNCMNGIYAACVEQENDGVYLNLYEQNHGSSNFQNKVSSLELNEERVNAIMEYYKRLAK